MDQTRYLSLTSRLLVGLPFLLFGLGRATTYDATAAMIEAVGLRAPPLAFLGAVSLEIIGGAMLVAGYKVGPVAALLAIFSVVTTV